jgi:hypothetical protein
MSGQPKDKSNLKLISQTPAELASYYGFRIQPVPGDGNCFYHSFLDQLRQNQRNYYQINGSKYYIPLDHKSLRAIAMNHVETNKDIYKDSMVENQTVEEFMKERSKNGVWAGDVEGAALAREFGLNVVIFKINNPFNINHEKPDNQNNIYLIHVGQCHYESLTPKAGESLAAIEARVSAMVIDADAPIVIKSIILIEGEVNQADIAPDYIKSLVDIVGIKFVKDNRDQDLQPLYNIFQESCNPKALLQYVENFKAEIQDHFNEEKDIIDLMEKYYQHSSNENFFYHFIETVESSIIIDKDHDVLLGLVY